MKMSRLVTFAILLAILAVVGILFYQVMAGFLLPLFLAALLTVMFRPLYIWILAKCRGRQHIASLLTTIAILTSVLAPLGIILAMAIHEGNQLLALPRGNMIQQFKAQLAGWTDQLGLQKPFVEELDALDEPLSRLETLTANERLDETTERAIAVNLNRLDQALGNLMNSLEQLRGFVANLNEAAHTWQDYLEDRTLADQLAVRPPQPLLDGRWGSAELRAVSRLHEAGSWEALQNQVEQLRGTLQALRQPEALEIPWEIDRMATLREQIGMSRLTLVNLRTDLRGGPIRAWITDMFSPGEAQYRYLQGKARELLQRWLPTVTGQATALVGGLIFGLVIMSISLFYFFLDGPTMIHAFMKLSPLDDQYERELLAEFDKVSRAVVVATLLSAVVQGLLAGVGFFFAGIDSVFLLTFLTMILALVPFVGAAAIWVPVCIWLAAVDGRWTAAIVLGLWGVGVVSMADNLIKPMVLHGQSKLHPLLGLLSVLGGVQALGPIGILVGPMLVSLMQALLSMVNQELERWSQDAEQAA